MAPLPWELRGDGVSAFSAPSGGGSTPGEWYEDRGVAAWGQGASGSP